MTIRYGIIGTGWITEAFLAGAAGVPGMALRAVCSRSEERGREFAARHGADLVFTDPVSYTHLDVYKRQSLASSGRGSSQLSPPGSQKSGSSVCQPSTSFWRKMPYSYSKE